MVNQTSNHLRNEHILQYYQEVLNKIKSDVDLDSASLSEKYEALFRIALSAPELAKEVFEIIKTGLKLHDSAYTLSGAYRVMGNVARIEPKLKEDVLYELHKAIQLNENLPYSLKTAYEILSDFELKPAVLDVWKTALKSSCNSDDSYTKAFNVLGAIVQEKPHTAPLVLSALQDGLQSNQHSSRSLKALYETLKFVLIADEKSTDPVLKTFQKVFGADMADVSEDALYHTLSDIASQKPELAPQVLETLKICAQNSEHNRDSFYDALATVVKVKPELAKKAYQVLKEYSQFSSFAPKDCYIALNVLVNVEPKLARPAFEEIKKYLKEEEHRLNLDLACQALNSIIQIEPALSKKVLDLDIQSEYMALLYKNALKNLPLEETIIKHPQIEQELRIAHKGRFASDAEFLYAFNHLDKDYLENSMIFSSQQRVMNILVGLGAEEKGISKEEAHAFRRADASKRIKKYVAENEDWLISASFKGAAIFKEYFPSYIKAIQIHNRKNPEDKLSIHDALYWLPKPMESEKNAHFSQFIRKNIIYQNAEHKDVHRPLSELKTIARYWEKLEDSLQLRAKDISQLKYQDVLSLCESDKYADQRCEAFAMEAAKHRLPEFEYHECEDIYLAGLKVPEPFDSSKRFQEGKYVGRFLPREDVRTIFFGEYTDCCQHWGGAGQSCAVSTVMDPFSQLFVVEDDKGKIIAGSWTWENTEGEYKEVCFDNIEALGELTSRPELNKIYEMAGEYLTKEENCRRVTIGLGYQDADVSSYRKIEDAIKLPLRYGRGYTDAKRQVLLNENPNAVPLDQTKESRRYIRDMCFLDMENILYMSETALPKSDQLLHIPSDAQGLVIEDSKIGGVGYCLYDKEKKEIYDMVVLPAYRKDQNASSSKLLLEMMKIVQKEGGRWCVQIRGETAMRYFSIMEKRGVIKFEEQRVDISSDRSKIVTLTFEPTKKLKMREKTEIETKQGKTKPKNLVMVLKNTREIR